MPQLLETAGGWGNLRGVFRNRSSREGGQQRGLKERKKRTNKFTCGRYKREVPAPHNIILREHIPGAKKKIPLKTPLGGTQTPEKKGGLKDAMPMVGSNVRGTGGVVQVRVKMGHPGCERPGRNGIGLRPGEESLKRNGKTGVAMGQKTEKLGQKVR